MDVPGKWIDRVRQHRSLDQGDSNAADLQDRVAHGRLQGVLGGTHRLA